MPEAPAGPAASGPVGGASASGAGGGGAPGVGGGPPDDGTAGTGGSGAGVAGSGVAGGASGAGGVAGGSATLPGGVEWEPWPSVPQVSDGICQVALFHGGDALSPPVPADVEIREFDPATGIMKRQFAPFGNLPAELAYAVFNGQGSPAGGCNVSVDPYGCTEWVRDKADNVTVWAIPAYSDRNFQLSFLDAAEFGTRAHGSVQTRYTVTYDADGALASGRNAACCGAPVQTFTEDAQHRCSDVLWEGTDSFGNLVAGKTELEHWTWEGDRLVSRVTTNGADPSQVVSVVTYTYDGDGALSATVVDGYATPPAEQFAEGGPRRDRGLRGSIGGARRRQSMDRVVRFQDIPGGRERGSRWQVDLRGAAALEPLAGVSGHAASPAYEHQMPVRADPESARRSLGRPLHDADSTLSVQAARAAYCDQVPAPTSIFQVVL